MGFKRNEGKNTQIILGKDLFIKEFVNKEAIFECKILNVKINHEVKIDNEFAKNLGAKDLNNLKELISKQINDEYKNSLDMLSKNQILDQLDKIKIEEVPKELIDQEIKV